MRLLYQLVEELHDLIEENARLSDEVEHLRKIKAEYMKFMDETIMHQDTAIKNWVEVLPLLIGKGKKS
jgi:regulator of replication initiation timing